MYETTPTAILIPHTPTDPGRPDNHRLAGSFIAGFRSAETRKAYAYDLRCWFEFLNRYQVDLLEARRPVVEAYMRELEDLGLANNTRGRRLSTIKSFYNWAVEEELLPASPAIRVKAPAKDHPIMPAMNHAEARRFVKAAEADPDPYCTAALHLMLFCGLRVTEVCTRDVRDLRVVEWVPLLEIRGKGDKVRHAELPPQVMAAVERALAGRTSGPLVINQAGNRLNVTNVRRQVERVRVRADIAKHLSPHCLRRSMIQLSLAEGRSLRDVQKAAGHANAQTTIGYDTREMRPGRSPAYAIQAAVA